ncbi:MAG: HAD-IC family P-type ATPase [Bauldia sp.]|nr:HAD-IC family P-type ATPase [Bauldia sp.]
MASSTGPGSAEAAVAPDAGLSEAAARALRERGEGNAVHLATSRSYFAIIRSNLFNFFNNILFTIGIALIALGEWNDAMTSVGLGLVNAIIGTIQELRAKRQLDRIALLHRPKVTLVRDGAERVADPDEIVKGDHIRLRPGDQVLVDGDLIAGGVLEMDESLLTGESEAERKSVGDSLLSGSICLSGEGTYRADVVGAESYANRLTAEARAFQFIKTPLQKQIDFAVRLVMLVVVLMSGTILVSALLQDLPTSRIVQLAAVLSGQVPYGLFFVIIVAYSLGAAAIAKQGALVQQVNAVESLSDADILCVDKTGTLTTNALTLHAVEPLGGESRQSLEPLIGSYARSVGSPNQTTTALTASLAGEALEPGGVIAFSSARKWSATAFADGPLAGVHALGAFEMLAPHLVPSPETAALADRVGKIAETGLRVLLFAGTTEATSFAGTEEAPDLPPLVPLALVILADVLRPNVAATFAAFAKLGLRLKIISGDDPNTVAALARQANLPVAGIASGPEIAQMSPAELATVIDEVDVFGRIVPAQKEQIVTALIAKGHHVAMVGDGVNDVLALKKAQLGIAMNSGSPAARNVADIVLLNDDFQPLQTAFFEGQRVLSGMTTALLLFLSRVASSILVIIAITMLGLTFPFEPAQMALTLFTVGIPTFFLTLWARPVALRENLLRRLVRFVIPVAVVTMAFGVALYTFHFERVQDDLESYKLPVFALQNFERVTGLSVDDGAEFAVASATIVAQSALSMFVTFTAFVLILFLAPPIRLFTGWVTEVSADKRPTIMAAALAIVFLVVLFTETLAEYFGLIAVGRGVYLSVVAVLPAWAALLLLNWRFRWFERFLGLAHEAG